jgi:hypothetical protein
MSIDIMTTSLKRFAIVRNRVITTNIVYLLLILLDKSLVTFDRRYDRNQIKELVNEYLVLGEKQEAMEFTKI